MSAEHDDQDIELIDNQQSKHMSQMFHWTSTKKNAWGDSYSPQSWSSLVKWFCWLARWQSWKKPCSSSNNQMLDSTIQLGNQTLPLIFGNATPINRPTNIRPTMFSPSSPTTTTGGAPPVVPTPTISSTSVEDRVAIVDATLNTLRRRRSART